MMRRALQLAGVVAGFGLLAVLGCDMNFMQTQQNGPGLGNGGGQAPPVAQESGPWVIILQEFAGPGRQRMAEQGKKNLVARRWGGVGTLHDSNDQRSYVYLGPFKAEELGDNLKQVRSYTDAAGVRPFVAAYNKKLPPPTPEAPPEWSLTNAPRTAFWSLQIGYYVDPGPAWPATSKLMKLPPGWNRKKAAVDACGELRKAGFEAYYYHGPSMSVITLGAFPADIYRFVSDPANPHHEGYDPKTDTFADPKLTALRDTVMKDANGKDDRPFRYNSENGNRIYKVQTLVDGTRVRKAPPSFLVQIPRPGEDLE